MDETHILVTGGLGFIGSHLVRHLHSTFSKAVILVIDKYSYASSIRNVRGISDSPRFSLQCIDLADENRVKQTVAMFRPEIVFHLAAESHVDRSFDNSLAFTHSNVVGTHNLLEACRTEAPSIKLFVHMSTDEVYGSGRALFEPEDSHCPKTSILMPTNPYSASKAAAEMQVVAYHHSFSIPAVIIRCNNVYGPGQFCEKVVPRFILQSMAGVACTIHGSGRQMRSFLHVNDAVSGIMALVENCLGNHHAPASKKILEIVNIGATKEITIRQLADIIFAQGKETGAGTGAEGASSVVAAEDVAEEDQVMAVSHVEDRKFNDFRYPVDVAMIRKLGWKETVPFVQGLKQTFEWYRENASEWFLPEDLHRAIHSDGHFSAQDDSHDTTSSSISNPGNVLLVGATGWIGPKVQVEMEKMGLRVVHASFRLQDTRAMWEEILRVRPLNVVLCAGITGRPNIDWCETNVAETVAVNLEGTVTLAQICSRLRIHLTNFATGCIYTGGADKTFDESDHPNFIGSLYSRTKAHAENIQVGAFGSNTLVLRLRMPIGEDIDHPRNLIAKLRNYSRLINLPNSVSVLSELLPIAAHMTYTNHTGLYNFTNPGHITPADIMSAFDRTFPDQAKPWEAVQDTEILFSSKAIVAPRSNCVLSSYRLYGYASANGLSKPNSAVEAIQLLFERCKGREG